MVAKEPAGAVKASHILIAYQGSQAATPNTTRTKEEAKAKAEELLAKAKTAGTDFAELARENSEEPGAAYSGGDLGFFGKGAMVKPFEEFAFANPVGNIGLVELWVPRRKSYRQSRSRKHRHYQPCGRTI